MRNGGSRHPGHEYRHLLVQLRTAAGLVGVGLLGSGSGGCTCPIVDYDRCIEHSQIEGWREANGENRSDLCPDLEEFRRYAGDNELPQPEWVVYTDDAGTPHYDQLSQTNRCCYKFTAPRCNHGRPFLVNDQPRVGTICGVVAGHRSRGAAWRRDALMEHASIAAFARLTLELLHHGAPLDLVARAQAASLDEIRHAQICKRRGEEVAGERWDFGVLSTEDSLADLTLYGFLRRNIVEGCIGETIAACVVSERARCAEDPELQRELEQIAEDETRHAALAFSILEWVSRRHPSLRVEMGRVFNEELARIEAEAIPPLEDDALGTSAGQIPARDVSRIQREVCAYVLRPLARDLGTSGATHDEDVRVA